MTHEVDMQLNIETKLKITKNKHALPLIKKRKKTLSWSWP